MNATGIPVGPENVKNSRFSKKKEADERIVKDCKRCQFKDNGKLHMVSISLENLQKERRVLVWLGVRFTSL